MTSTGTGLSATVRSVRRVPVMTMVCSSGLSAAACARRLSGGLVFLGESGRREGERAQRSKEQRACGEFHRGLPRTTRSIPVRCAGNSETAVVARAWGGLS